MEGVAGAHFVYPIPQEGLIDAAAFTAQAAIEAGVRSLVDMSQVPARREAKSHTARDHWVSERVFDWSGVPTTHMISRPPRSRAHSRVVSEHRRSRARSR
jgi:NAD(P)H dehydrogenase (quinone)